MNNISFLPHDLQSHIFSFLQDNDQLSLRISCKNWCDFHLFKNAQKKEVIDFVNRLYQLPNSIKNNSEWVSFKEKCNQFTLQVKETSSFSSLIKRVHWQFSTIVEFFYYCNTVLKVDKIVPCFGFYYQKINHFPFLDFSRPIEQITTQLVKIAEDKGFKFIELVVFHYYHMQHIYSDKNSNDLISAKEKLQILKLLHTLYTTFNSRHDKKDLINVIIKLNQSSFFKNQFNELIFDLTTNYLKNFPNIKWLYNYLKDLENEKFNTIFYKVFFEKITNFHYNEFIDILNFYESFNRIDEDFYLAIRSFIDRLSLNSAIKAFGNLQQYLPNDYRSIYHYYKENYDALQREQHFFQIFTNFVILAKAVLYQDGLESATSYIINNKLYYLDARIIGMFFETIAKELGYKEALEFVYYIVDSMEDVAMQRVISLKTLMALKEIKGIDLNESLQFFSKSMQKNDEIIGKDFYFDYCVEFPPVTKKRKSGHLSKSFEANKKFRKF
ncbi:MAG: hypothetical protein BGO10_01245 [Chlamydia sp. 32-24]|nr:MAG: hypothetical protein BGO10_01245 [Chlamydia sp. 32-24]